MYAHARTRKTRRRLVEAAYVLGGTTYSRWFTSAKRAETFLASFTHGKSAVINHGGGHA